MENFNTVNQADETKERVRPVEVGEFSFNVIRQDPFGFYVIKPPIDVVELMTPAMQGVYTTPELAMEAIQLWWKNFEIALAEVEAEEAEQEEEVEDGERTPLSGSGSGPTRAEGGSVSDS